MYIHAYIYTYSETKLDHQNANQCPEITGVRPLVGASITTRSYTYVFIDSLESIKA